MEKLKTCFLLIIITLAVLLLVRDFGMSEIDSNSTKWNGKQEIEKEAVEVGQIAIPGQTEMYFKAGETVQKVNIYNPEENDCTIVFSLSVDGKTIWKSGECLPGYGYYEIEIKEPLEAGTYTAYLFHECFKDGQRLNSAIMNTKLIVQ